MDRTLVRTDSRCPACGRAAYVRRDGTEYLYRYRLHGPAVCSPRCDRKCTCQAPEPESGVALCANDCPVHTDVPADWESAS